MLYRVLILAAAVHVAVPVPGAEITRIWLTHRTHQPDKLVVNWETDTPGNSVVRYGLSNDSLATVAQDENVTLHHVEIPLAHRDAVYHYTVTTGQDRSSDATFKAYPTDTLRLAVVANWHAQPSLDAIARDNVHLLLTAGDNITSLHCLCGEGVKDCTRPYSQLIARYPELFRSTPFMPALGNHDREIRARGKRYPPQSVYDVDATAFRKFFELPDDEWKWHFDIPDFSVRFVALDLNHISDQGTTWQTCHPLTKDSPQYQWYDRVTSTPRPEFLVTVQNERNSTIRAREGNTWHEMFRRGTIAIAGFGQFAERAEVDGLAYYNTSLAGRGDKYPDPHSTFFHSEDNYLLLTFTRNPQQMTVEIKSLDGKMLDRKQYPASSH